jgi:hypothetical protein
MTIAITRLELSAADLRDAARRTRDAKATWQMVAIALVLEGWSRQAGRSGHDGPPDAVRLGVTATTSWDCRACLTGRVATGRRRVGRPSSRPRWKLCCGVFTPRSVRIR